MKLVLSLLAATLAAGAALAQTPDAAPMQSPAPGYGQGGMRAPASPEMRAARRAMRETCQADMTRLCGDTQANAGAPPAPGQADGQGGGERRAMGQCLRDHVADLSDGCKASLKAMRDLRRSEGGGAPGAMGPGI